MITRRQFGQGMAVTAVTAAVPQTAAAASTPISSEPVPAVSGEIAAAANPSVGGVGGPIQIVSAHNFLYRDRHEKLYTDIRVYLNGDRGKVAPFLAFLEEGKTADEIRDSLKLDFRGDVWFATLLVHLYLRHGVETHPTLKPDIPAALLPQLEKLEADWQAAIPYFTKKESSHPANLERS